MRDDIAVVAAELEEEVLGGHEHGWRAAVAAARERGRGHWRPVLGVGWRERRSGR
ncbi:hypothetical protein [Actinokineospora cianjurensis]|uniref:hypothetical protein n=1 Tax=Actinokineospora cianjurensis TaxID=585224 RepID=UPI0014769A97|nr:hypothetical protein [Actinokineospora cianjurensis]